MRSEDLALLRTFDALNETLERFQAWWQEHAVSAAVYRLPVLTERRSPE